MEKITEVEAIGVLLMGKKEKLVQLDEPDLVLVNEKEDVFLVRDGKRKKIGNKDKDRIIFLTDADSPILDILYGNSTAAHCLAS